MINPRRKENIATALEILDDIEGLFRVEGAQTSVLAHASSPNARLGEEVNRCSNGYFARC